MKNSLKIFFLLLTTGLFSGCEKDDICADGTPTTPRLIIEFYSKDNSTVRKIVANLKIQGEGAATTLNFNQVDTIELPLKTNENFTNYSFNINSTSSTATNNTDLIRFNYIVNDIYVSRACGFKSFFNLNLANGVVKTNPEGDDFFWIENVEIVKSNVETEEDVHIKMYF
ncbi:DUF6452 family protein [Flavobacterium lacus]|uniref:Lipoprotein n=1 Tax=Flavobacterium lacus TaxID=1353778 RepID=A0A328WMD1_9FLAO|nr:DUF6452 family protein [Flavobacterium lacus]RAR47293.1 hypothetical protein B0I10_11087 [Flavobacterium lacus]